MDLNLLLNTHFFYLHFLKGIFENITLEDAEIRRLHVFVADVANVGQSQKIWMLVVTSVSVTVRLLLFSFFLFLNARYELQKTVPWQQVKCTDWNQMYSEAEVIFHVRSSNKQIVKFIIANKLFSKTSVMKKGGKKIFLFQIVLLHLDCTTGLKVYLWKYHPVK